MHDISRSSRRSLFVVGVAVLLLVSCSDDSTPTSPPPNAPKILCPSPVSALSLTGQPVVVQYSAATATLGTPPVTISCVPPTGSSFAVGSSTVTCTATDSIRQTDTCTFAVTVTAPPKISLTSFVAFGDSITAGEIITEGDRFGFRRLLVDYARSYPTDLQTDLTGYYTGQAQSIFVSNQGSKGETTTPGITRLATVLSAARYQALLLMEGANDFPNFVGALNNIQTMVRYGKAQGLQVFLATLPPENPNATGSCVAGASDRGTYAALVPPYNNGLSNIASYENIPLVDVYQAFGGVASPDLIDCDGLHPTAMGYQLIADTFFKSLKANLSVTPSTSTRLPAAPVSGLLRRK